MIRRWILAGALGLVVLAPLDARAQDALAIANEAITGTTLNKLAKITGAPSTAIISGTGDTDNIIGIVVAGAGTTNSAIVAVLGSPNCIFDATSVVAGDYVTNSASVAGACHDAGATRPTGSQVIGRALASGGGGSTIAVSMDKGFANTAGSTSFANPSATASDTAVNGGAGTAMRSDAAPAVQKGTNAQFGLVKGDSSTITCVAGVCSSLTGGAGTVTNPSNLTTHAPLIGGANGTTDAKAIAAMTNGQLPIGSTGADPVPAVPTASTADLQIGTSAGGLNFGIYGQTAVHDANCGTLTASGSYIVAFDTVLTAARSCTLPAASAMKAGQRIVFVDQGSGSAAAINGANTVTINRAGSDKIASATSVVMSQPFCSITLVSDASANFSVAANSCATVPVTQGGLGLTAVSADQVPTGTAANTYAAKTLTNCTDTGGNHLNYDTSTHTWSCGTSSSGGGGVTCEANFSASGGDCIWTQTASTSATIDWTTLTHTNYDLRCSNLLPATDAADFHVLLHDSSGWLAANYNWFWHYTGTSDASLTGTADTKMELLNSLHNVAPGLTSLDAWFHGIKSGTSTQPALDFRLMGLSSAGPSYITTGGAANYTGTITTAIDGIRVKFSAGNITSGTCTLYSRGA